MKNPIILPKGATITDKIILDHHYKAVHAGPELTLRQVRLYYWVPGGRQQVRKAIHLRGSGFENIRTFKRLLNKFRTYRLRELGKETLRQLVLTLQDRSQSKDAGSANIQRYLVYKNKVTTLLTHIYNIINVPHDVKSNVKYFDCY